MLNKKYTKKISEKLTLFVIADKKEYFIFKDELVVNAGKKIRYVDNVKLNDIPIKFPHLDLAISYVDNQSKTKAKLIKFTESQNEELKKMAKEQGMDVKDYIKKVALQNTNEQVINSAYNKAHTISLSNDELNTINELMEKSEARTFTEYVRNKIFK